MERNAGKLFSRETVRGEPIRIGDRELIPIVRKTTFQLHVPWAGFAAVWARPRAVEVREGDTVHRMGIVDVGTMIWLGMLLLAIVTGISRRRHANESERKVEEGPIGE